MEFFEKDSKNINVSGSGIDLERFCVVYLAYFDEARGHQLLLVHPPELKDDEEFLQNESKTIFIHSIWWMSVELQEELSHVDLEFGGRNYLAKKFHAPSERKKKRSGMDETTPETIVLILNIPINLNPFGGELLNRLYARLTEKYISDFSTDIKKSICEAKIIKSPKDKQSCIEGEKILSRMTTTIRDILKEYGKELEVNIGGEGEKQKALAYLLYQDIKKRPQPRTDKDLFFEDTKTKSVIDISSILHDKIKLENATLLKNENKINLSLVNVSNEDIENCVVSIAYVEDFFEKYFYDVDIDFWFEGEELNFQFERVSKKIKEEYLITVKQDANVIFQQKIQSNKLKEE